MEEADFRKVRQFVVIGEDGQNRNSFLGAGIGERFSGSVLTHGIDQSQAFFLYLITALGLTTRQAAQYIKDAMETLDEETEDDDGEMS